MRDPAFVILFVIFLAFVFEFINGFHDAANSIATIVTTGVLSPNQAVMWAAFFNFIAFLVFNLSVAATIGNGLINPAIVDAGLILAALVGAIVWNLLTWYYGLPSSSSHALIGGLAGAGIAKAGLGTLQWSGLNKVFIGLLLSPILGLVAGYLLMVLLNYLTKNQSKKINHRLFASFQLASSALLSLTHGGNDAQKTMGIIAVLLFSASWIGDTFYVPFWVVISCHLVISLGTLAGGWRIVHTMGTKITALNPMRGCAAETGAALIIFMASQYGVPVSTTHTVTGSIAGVGLIKGLGGTHWPILQRIFFSWIVTIPVAGLIAACIVLLTSFLI